MPTVATIYIQGEILPENYIWPEYEATSLYRVRKQVEAAGEFDSIQLNIFTPGGYCLEGWAIVDYLISLGKPINTLAFGQCASFGTVLHTMGTVREITPHCDYVIHRPWDFFIGNDLQIDEANRALKKETVKLFEHYAIPTGNTVDELAALIQKEDLKLSPQESVDHRFSTAIFKVGASASARLNELDARKQKPSYLMNLKDRKVNPDAPNDFTPTKTAMSTIKDTLRSAAKAALAFLDGEGAKALNVPLKDGSTIVTNSTGDDPVVGDTVTLPDGSAAPDGEYTTDKDQILTVTDGVITAINPVDDTVVDSTTTDATALAKQLSDLQTKYTELENRAKASDDKLEAFEKRVRPVLAAAISQDPNTQANHQPTDRGAQMTDEQADRAKMLEEHLAQFGLKPTV